jgi:hypothetical protein
VLSKECSARYVASTRVMGCNHEEWRERGPVLAEFKDELRVVTELKVVGSDYTILNAFVANRVL